MKKLLIGVVIFSIPLLASANSTTTVFVAVNDCNFRQTSPRAGGSYLTARDASSSTPDNTSATGNATDHSRSATNWIVGRSIYKFNTTSLPANAVIVTSTFQIKSNGNGTDTTGTSTVVLTQHSSVGAGNCASTDYFKDLFTTTQDSMALSTFISGSAYRIFNVTSTAINTSTYSAFGMRDLADINSQQPSVDGDNTSGVNFLESTGNEPYLYVTWTQNISSSSPSSSSNLDFVTSRCIENGSTTDCYSVKDGYIILLIDYLFFLSSAIIIYLFLNKMNKGKTYKIN